MAVVVLAFGCISMFLGKDDGWDFLNYHWYDAYAFLHGRLGFDVAVAHQATYFNPLIHLPFYWLATAGTSWLAQPADASGLTASMRERVAAHRGDLYLLAAPLERMAADRATSAYGLEVLTADCREIHSNLGGPYQLCPLRRRAQ